MQLLGPRSDLGSSDPSENANISDWGRRGWQRSGSDREGTMAFLQHRPVFHLTKGFFVIQMKTAPPQEKDLSLE